MVGGVVWCGGSGSMKHKLVSKTENWWLISILESDRIWFGCQKSTLETAKVRIRKETTRLLPEVQQEIEKNKEKHQRGKRKSTVEKEESMKKAKEERRKLALNED